MTDYSELMKRLREIKDWWREPGHTAEMAADAIEEQAKRIAELERQLNYVKNKWADSLNQPINLLRARILTGENK